MFVGREREHFFGADWDWLLVEPPRWSKTFGVRLKDADDAADLVDQSIPDSFRRGKGVGEYRQPRCPNCRSVSMFPLRD